MAWEPMIPRTDPKSCPTCNGYGGIYDPDGELDGEGLPPNRQCPDCRTNERGEIELRN